MQMWSCMLSTLRYCPSVCLPIGLRLSYIHMATVTHELHQVAFCFLASSDCYHSITITFLTFMIFTPGGYIILQSVISWSLYFVWGQLSALHLVLEYSSFHLFFFIWKSFTCILRLVLYSSSSNEIFSFKNSYPFFHNMWYIISLSIYAFVLLSDFKYFLKEHLSHLSLNPQEPIQ